jgi:hypothetical protein
VPDIGPHRHTFPASVHANSKCYGAMYDVSTYSVKVSHTCSNADRIKEYTHGAAPQMWRYHGEYSTSPAGNRSLSWGVMHYGRSITR